MYLRCLKNSFSLAIRSVSTIHVCRFFQRSSRHQPSHQCTHNVKCHTNNKVFTSELYRCQVPLSSNVTKSRCSTTLYCVSIRHCVHIIDIHWTDISTCCARLTFLLPLVQSQFQSTMNMYEPLSTNVYQIVSLVSFYHGPLLLRTELINDNN